jgi:hypothetical protein
MAYGSNYLTLFRRAGNYVAGMVKATSKTSALVLNYHLNQLSHFFSR